MTFVLNLLLLLSVLLALCNGQCIQLNKFGTNFKFAPTDKVFFKTRNEGLLKGIRVVPAANGKCLQLNSFQLKLAGGGVLGVRDASVISDPRQFVEKKVVVGVTSPFARMNLVANRFKLKLNNQAGQCLSSNSNGFLDVQPCATADVFVIS